MTRPFRLTAPEPYELDLHAACCKALDKLLLPPALWCCYPAGVAQLSPQQMARYSRLGLKRGFPDLLLWYHGCWGIEIKRLKGRLSKTRIVQTRRGAPRVLIGQEEMFPKLIDSGGFAAIAIIHDVDEMLAQLATWGLPLRPGPYLRSADQLDKGSARGEQRRPGAEQRGGKLPQLEAGQARG